MKSYALNIQLLAKKSVINREIIFIIKRFRPSYMHDFIRKNLSNRVAKGLLKVFLRF